MKVLGQRTALNIQALLGGCELEYYTRACVPVRCFCEYGTAPSGLVKGIEFAEILIDSQLRKKSSALWNQLLDGFSAPPVPVLPLISFPYISAFTLSSNDSSCYTRSNAWSTRTLSIPALTFELSLLLISFANYHAQSYFIGMFVVLGFMYSGYASLKPKIIFKIW